MLRLAEEQAGECLACGLERLVGKECFGSSCELLPVDQCGHVSPQLSCWFMQLLWGQDQSCRGLVWICAEETPSP